MLSQETRTISFSEKDNAKPISGSLFNITLSLHGFPWKKGNIALKGGDHHLVVGTRTAKQMNELFKSSPYKLHSTVEVCEGVVSLLNSQASQ